MKTPCYNCERRCVGCHGNCEEYKKFSEERQKLNNTARFREDIVPKRMLDNLKVGWRR